MQSLEISKKLHYLAQISANDDAETNVLYSYSQAIARGISQTEFTKQWAEHLGLVYINPTTVQNWHLPQLTGTQIETVLAAKLINFDTIEGGIRILIASDIANLPALKALITQDISLKTRIFLCTPQEFVNFIYAQFGEVLVQHTTTELEHNAPQFSAKLAMPMAVKIGLAVAVSCAVYCASFFATPLVLHGAMVVLSLCFAGGAALRFVSLMAAIGYREPEQLPQENLPIYSILVPLYKEVEIIPQLIQALHSLDYPPELLDIKLILEQDDIETCTIIQGMDFPAFFEIIIVADSAPRTKPKALMAAMPRVKGEIITIYDAEDVPDPQQLRRIVQKFRELPAEYACIQAALTVDKRQKDVLQQLFALEYETWFTMFLRGFAAMKLPLPLGGTSNHFKATILRKVGGWDPYNVTEDADLGLRLARMDYKTNIIASKTLEEAPASLNDWMNQRSRWMKGWFQTLAVHYQNPSTLIAQMGLWHAIAVLFLFGGSLLGAMLFPISIVLAGVHFFYPDQFLPATQLGIISLACMKIIFVFGISVPILANIYTAIRARNLFWLGLIPILPFYWILVSIAGWQACLELHTRPFHWHKTPHKGINY